MLNGATLGEIIVFLAWFVVPGICLSTITKSNFLKKKLKNVHVRVVKTEKQVKLQEPTLDDYLFV